MKFLSRFYRKPPPDVVSVPQSLPAMDMGLTDAVQSGWFNNETGEVFKGFPVGPGDVVADIGCGPGGGASFCARQGARLILADVDEHALARAAARVRAEPGCAGVETHRTDSDPLPLPDGVANRIVCTEVIEHVRDPARLLAELARIGTPGALYLLSCPDPDSEMIQKHVAPPEYFAPPNHIRVIQRDEFARLVEAAGLTIVARHSDGFFRAIWLTLFWATGTSLEQAEHPLLSAWSETWRLLLEQPRGLAIKHALDHLRPMQQIIVARKP